MTTPTLLSDEELAPLLQRKRQLQADLASQSQSSCGSGGCCGSQSSCGTSAAPSSATGKPNVLKALLITGSVLGVIALAWWI
ncbi:MAG: hypothetical protein PHU77_10940 [Simplicispira sp.]|nr:hypothetical protein [Simplicispira sp.]